MGKNFITTKVFTSPWL